MRLLPGFMGNPASLTEESHEDGLLEYPVYTKPASWRGHEVPAGAALRRPRRDRRAGATSRRYAARPSAVPTSPTRPGSSATSGCGWSRPGDAGELYTLQLACWVGSSRPTPSVEIAALAETLPDVRGLARRGHDAAWSAAPAGWSAPCAAASRRRRGRLGHRPADGRPGPARAAAWAGCCSARSSRPRAAGRDVVRAGHRRRQPRATSGCTGRPATGAPVGAVAPGVVRLTKRRARPPGFPARVAAVANFAPWPSRPKDRSGGTHGGSASRSCHRGSRRRRPARRWSAPSEPPIPRLTCGTCEEQT